MSLYIDRKYLLLSSARLRNFKQKNDDLFNFSCPFCGDSEKNHLKARGYISRSRKFNGYIYTCHNCNVSTNFDNFLLFLDADKHKEYVMEKFKEYGKGRPTVESINDSTLAAAKADSHKPKASLEAVSLDDITLPIISELPKEHFARVYIEKRMIPEEYYDEIFFAEDYKYFLDDTWPHHGKEKLLEKDPRIVLFYTDSYKGITNVSGRSLTVADMKLRYITVKVSPERKVYGLHRLNPDLPSYVTEGQFDSMLLPNAVASGDSNLIGLGTWLYNSYKIKPTLIFDNEPRNKQIVKSISDAMLGGWSLVIWPKDFPAKDINDALLSGLTLKEIHAIVTANTVSGLKAHLALSKWRLC